MPIVFAYHFVIVFSKVFLFIMYGNDLSNISSSFEQDQYELHIEIVIIYFFLN